MEAFWEDGERSPIGRIASRHSETIERRVGSENGIGRILLVDLGHCVAFAPFTLLGPVPIGIATPLRIVKEQKASIFD